MSEFAVASDRKTVFLHVPKTGGNTFQTVLRLVYGAGSHVCRDASIASIEAALKKYDSVEFHLIPGGKNWTILHEEIVQQGRWDVFAGTDIFAMLRDPVDHYISQYFFVAKLRDRIEPLMKASGERFPDSLEEAMEIQATFNNQLAYMVAKTQLGGNYVDACDLAELKRVLVEMRVHVGLTERFSDSLNVFEAVTGRRIPGAVIHSKNRNSGRPELRAVSDDLRAKIRKLSELDTELYEFGRELFQQDLAQCGPTREYSFVASEYSTKGLIKAAGESAKRAAAWLVEHQLSSGAFQTEVCVGQRKGVEGETLYDLEPAACPFTTAIALYSMEFAKYLEPGIAESAKRGVGFLLSEMEPGGLWRFWSRTGRKRMALPPDLDDTSVISMVLKQHGAAFPDNRFLFYDSRDARGAFYTWLYKADSFRKRLLWLRTFGKAFAHSGRSNDLDAVCAVVNANVLTYLGDVAETRGAVEFLLKVFRDGTEAEAIQFYEHRMSLYYAASRALIRGVASLGEARATIARRIVGLQEPDDSFGDELRTAQAICALLNLEESREVLGRGVEFLISHQSPDGSWRRISMYGGMFSPTGYGSAEMTTALCMEALARYNASEKLD